MRSYLYSSVRSLVYTVSLEEIRHDFTGTPFPFVGGIPGYGTVAGLLRCFLINQIWGRQAASGLDSEYLYLPYSVNCNFSAQTELLHLWDQSQRELLPMMLAPKYKETRAALNCLLHIQLFPLLHLFANQHMSFPAGAEHARYNPHRGIHSHGVSRTYLLSLSKRAFQSSYPQSEREKSLTIITSSNSLAFASPSVFWKIQLTVNILYYCLDWKAADRVDPPHSGKSLGCMTRAAHPWKISLVCRGFIPIPSWTLMDTWELFRRYNIIWEYFSSLSLSHNLCFIWITWLEFLVGFFFLFSQCSRELEYHNLYSSTQP